MGTVTFLLTDIEGSTKLWERHPHTMPQALARHDTILRHAIETQGGIIFKTGGDGFHAAFPTAPQALTAALAAQRSLAQEPWANIDPLRVRMALHTGTVEMREGNYFGPPVSRVERLAAAGHGGQILLSATTQELVRDDLPPGVTLLDLGERRLKDLIRPERVYQAVTDDLIHDFPPLRSLEAFSHNLPLQVTTFVGRQREITEVKRQIQANRLTTLTGVGGTGKTRLSLQVAADLLEHFTNGVWLIELAPLADPSFVPQAVAQVLGVRAEKQRPLTQTLTEALRNKHLLLILDNCEHVIEASAHLAEALLRACPHLHILASSREALGIAGEFAWTVPSLTLPNPRQLESGAPTDLTLLTQYEAVRLFIDRALLVQPDFAITNTNAPAVAEICHRLDGIPLAIELAAAQVKALDITAIAERLDDRFRLLAGGGRAALPRQQTLQALIDWSYDLLPDDQKRLLLRLSIFQGGWTLIAAEEICAGDPIDQYDILDLLLHLVNKSLVVAEESHIPQSPAPDGLETPEGQTRYRLLETIRQYAREKLVERFGATAALAQIDALRDRHLTYFLHYAQQLKAIPGVINQKVWLARADAELDNIRAALEWASDPNASPERYTQGLTLATLWSSFWAVRGLFNEAFQWLTRLLDSPVPTAPLTRCKALIEAGSAGIFLGHISIAETLYTESLTISQSLGDQSLIADALLGLGSIASSRSEIDTAKEFYLQGLALRRAVGHKPALANTLLGIGRLMHEFGDYLAQKQYYEEALDIQRELGNKSGIAHALNMVGEVFLALEELAAARGCFQESLPIFQDLGNVSGSSIVLNSLGELARLEHDYQRAEGYYRQALALMRSAGGKRLAAGMSQNLGNTLLRLGRVAEALPYLITSLSDSHEVGDRHSMAFVIQSIAGAIGVALHQYPELLAPDRPHLLQTAALLLGTTDAYFQSSGVQIYNVDQAVYEANTAAVKQLLPPETFTALLTEGASLPLDPSISLALTTATTLSQRLPHP